MGPLPIGAITKRQPLEGQNQVLYVVNLCDLSKASTKKGSNVGDFDTFNAYTGYVYAPK